MNAQTQPRKMIGFIYYFFKVWFYGGILIILGFLLPELRFIPGIGIIPVSERDKVQLINREAAAEVQKSTHAISLKYRYTGKVREGGLLLPDGALLDLEESRKALTVYFPLKGMKRQRVLKALDRICLLLPAVCVLFFIYHISHVIGRMYHDQEIFALDYVTRLRWSALVLLLIPFLEFVLRELFLPVVADYLSISPSDIKYSLELTRKTNLPLIAMILLLAEIIRYGHALEEDQKLTI